MKRTSLEWIPLSVLGAIPSAAIAYHGADMSAPAEVVAMTVGVATIAAALVGFDDRLLRRGNLALRSWFIRAARVFAAVQLALVGVGAIGLHVDANNPVAGFVVGAQILVGALGLAAGTLVGRGVGAMIVPGSPGAVVAFVATVVVGSIWAIALVAVAALVRLALRGLTRSRADDSAA